MGQIFQKWDLEQRVELRRFRGKYKRGAGRTSGTFAGVVSVDEPKYVILIWVRRPRTNQWWGYTAGPIFKQLASYILSYDM